MSQTVYLEISCNGRFLYVEDQSKTFFKKLIDFNGMSIRLGISYAWWLRNYIYVHIYSFSVVFKSFFVLFFRGNMVLSKSNGFLNRSI